MILDFNFWIRLHTLLWGKLWEGIPCLPSSVLSSCSWFPLQIIFFKIFCLQVTTFPTPIVMWASHCEGIEFVKAKFPLRWLFWFFGLSQTTLLDIGRIPKLSLLTFRCSFYNHFQIVTKSSIFTPDWLLDWMNCVCGSLSPLPLLKWGTVSGVALLLHNLTLRLTSVNSWQSTNSLGQLSANS